MGEMRSEHFLLFLRVGNLVYHHSFIFCWLVLILNLLILPCLILSETASSMIFQEEEGEEEKIY